MLGGLRSLFAEVIWFRVDRLQDEGKFVELAQLMEGLSLMEPHTPEVWSYASWNLAYNVSVMMAEPDDRWYWVERGIELLRDRGLTLNPDEPEIYRELAWLFELKLAADIDSAASHYRQRWKKIVEDIAARNAWDELKMDPVRMKAVEMATGFTDWTESSLHAMYWAAKGLECAEGKARSPLENIIRQSAILYGKAKGMKVG